ncbi:NAD(P)-dependent oxidoreductase [Mucilaginibacter gynuensis]|uniref:NAD(P)-dependent oxidoreductase n=1 Tax=Mucilaginibacter gynuensis TaxID=1302236 RepID=A0ABP8G331_9SPHI
MKVAIIGASGFVGASVLTEALNRGHQVTAIVRNPEKITVQNDNLAVTGADIFETEKLAAILAGNDVVISSYNPGWGNPEIYDDFIKGSTSIQEATKAAGVKRLIVIGGAGSLYIDGNQLVDSPQFPAEWKAGATAARDFLTELRKEEELDWTFLSPAINLHPGERTGKFRLGTESPVFNEHGKNDISVADLAVALLDEVENKQFVKQRFTLGY